MTAKAAERSGPARVGSRARLSRAHSWVAVARSASSRWAKRRTSRVKSMSRRAREGQVKPWSASDTRSSRWWATVMVRTTNMRSAST